MLTDETNSIPDNQTQFGGGSVTTSDPPLPEFTPYMNPNYLPMPHVDSQAPSPPPNLGQLLEELKGIGEAARERREEVDPPPDHTPLSQSIIPRQASWKTFRVRKRASSARSTQH